eukprot:scaffold3380_cov106-Cylindrotheca_fusiformis.AAC.8
MICWGIDSKMLRCARCVSTSRTIPRMSRCMVKLRSLIVQLRNLGTDPFATTDAFGMSPLHILSFSQTPNMDMLLANDEDEFGSNPMNYQCSNRMSSSTEVIRRVLHTRFEYVLGLSLRPVDSALASDWTSKRREIQVLAVCLKLAKCEKKEILSIYEVNSEEQNAERESCRINSGSSVVTPHILPFLDKIDEEDYVVSSAFYRFAPFLPWQKYLVDTTDAVRSICWA